MADQRRVPTGLRALNALSVILFLAGAGLYGRAWMGMHGLLTFEAAAGADPGAATERYASLLMGSWIGVGLVASALVLAFGAALARHTLERQPGSISSR